LSVSPEGIAAAVSALADGDLVIVPTDTVYGIAADAMDEAAVRRLYAAKGKDETAPLQLLFSPEAALVERVAEWTGPARRLVEALGPGGWTVIVPAAPGWESAALAGGRTVGVRIPDAPCVWDVVRGLGRPVAASSANPHGSPSPKTCIEAVAGVGEHCRVALDAGMTAAGLDSTVIDCSKQVPRILREGAIDRLTVARILEMTEIEVMRSVRP
jgi:L-threonylcarbamoyladenylate synthase